MAFAIVLVLIKLMRRLMIQKNPQAPITDKNQIEDDLTKEGKELAKNDTS